MRAAGLAEWRYQLLPVAPELFSETVGALADSGFRAINVTIPHKQAALSLADDASDTATAIGAANVLVFGGGGAIRAENTDASGLLAALPSAPAGRSALVLGAGGSARAAVWALLRAGAEVRVWNRTPERARALCAELGGSPSEVIEPAELLVNCTSIGLDASGDFFKQLPITADSPSTSRMSSRTWKARPTAWA